MINFASQTVRGINMQKKKGIYTWDVDIDVCFSKLQEICVGILGNMACNRDVCAQMTKNTKFM